MKYAIISALFAVAALCAQAQTLTPMEPLIPEPEPTPSTVSERPSIRQKNPNEMSIRIAGYEMLIEKDNGEQQSTDSNRKKRKRIKPYGGRIGLLEVGFNGLAANTNAYSMYPAEERGFMDLSMGRSFNITVNIFTFSTAFTKKEIIGLSMGVGLAFNNLSMETPVHVAKVDRMIRPVEPDFALKKTKLKTVALHVPFVLEINPTRNFFISGGGYADLLLISQFKSKFPKEKLRNPYTNFVQAGVTVRMGFRNAYIFGNYALTELFKEGRGPSMNHYTFGLGFGF